MSLDHIFRAYDIRGKTGEELTPNVMERIGYAFAAQSMREHGEHTALIGHDVRTSSPEFSDAFKQGARKAGMTMKDVGMAPYGVVLYKGWQDGVRTAYITASHLPPGWNGVKFADGTGVGYSEEANMAIRDAFYQEEGLANRMGEEQTVEAVDQYKKYLRSQVDIGDVDVLMDCGNGSASIVAPLLFNEAGAKTTVINDTPDGMFPKRGSDVTKDSLAELRVRMQEGDHDVGIAYDGDADRVAAVDGNGRLLSSEQLGAVLLQQIAERWDGPVVANVECSRLLEHVAGQYGKDVIRVRVGHTYLFKAMREHSACLGVEKSGHIGVPHVLPMDDGIATSLYLAEVVSRLDQPLSLVVDNLPHYYQGRMSYRVPPRDKFAVMNALQDIITHEYQHTNTMDGVRVDKEKGWVLIRASNTTPKIRITIEAEDPDAFDSLNREFVDLIEDVFEEFGAAVNQPPEPGPQQMQNGADGSVSDDPVDDEPPSNGG